jgi:hypothetical protein
LEPCFLHCRFELIAFLLAHTGAGPHCPIEGSLGKLAV